MSASKATSLRLSPVQARASERLETLLDAAAELIDRAGYDTLTTQTVADQAGTSIGTVYRYFPDRLSILRALAERNAARLRGRADAQLAGRATAAELLAGLQRALIDAYREEPGFRRLKSGSQIGFGGGECLPGLREVLTGSIDASALAPTLLPDTAVGVLVALTEAAFEDTTQGDAALLDAGLALSRQAVTGVDGVSRG